MFRAVIQVFSGMYFHEFPSKHAILTDERCGWWKSTTQNQRCSWHCPAPNSWLSDAATHGTRLASSWNCVQAHQCWEQNGNHFPISGGEWMNSGLGWPWTKVWGEQQIWTDRKVDAWNVASSDEIAREEVVPRFTWNLSLYTGKQPNQLKFLRKTAVTRKRKCEDLMYYH